MQLPCVFHFFCDAAPTLRDAVPIFPDFDHSSWLYSPCGWSRFWRLIAVAHFPVPYSSSAGCGTGDQKRRGISGGQKKRLTTGGDLLHVLLFPVESQFGFSRNGCLWFAARCIALTDSLMASRSAFLPRLAHCLI